MDTAGICFGEVDSLITTTSPGVGALLDKMEDNDHIIKLDNIQI